MILLKQMLVFFLIMIIGFWLAKKDVMDEITSKKISWMVVNVCGPIMVVNSVLGDERVPGNMLRTVYIVAALIYLALVVFGLIIQKLLRATPVYVLMTIFGNVGFMGYPLVQEMYGQEAMLYAVVFNIMYNLLMYTFGITLMSGEKFDIHNLKKLLNGGMIASAIAFFLYAFPIPLPAFLVQAMQSVSNMTAPLSMMVIGASFVSMSAKELLGDVRLILFTFIRFIIVTIIIFEVLRMFVTDPTLLGVCLIMISCPVGSMNLMVAHQYGGDTKTASKGIAFTTALSVVIMPVLSLILM